MLSLAIHLVLLFAVACSQIFGGIACCCLSRSIIDSFSTTQAVAASVQLAPATAQQPTAAKCPRCVASQASASGSVNAKKTLGCGVAGTCGCQCNKAAASATVQLEPRFQISNVQSVVPPSSTWDLVPCSTGRVLHEYQIPIRFGGPSWQSVACLWKK